MRSMMMYVLMILLLSPSLIAQPRLSDKEIIQAFLECPEIIAAQKELSKGAQPGEPMIVLRNMHCGAVGCQHTTLVAQPFERRQVNPFVVHILGYVHVGPKENITLVERVELEPVKAVEGEGKIHDK